MTKRERVQAALAGRWIGRRWRSGGMFPRSTTPRAASPKPCSPSSSGRTSTSSRSCRAASTASRTGGRQGRVPRIPQRRQNVRAARCQAGLGLGDAQVLDAGQGALSRKLEKVDGVPVQRVPSSWIVYLGLSTRRRSGKAETVRARFRIGNLAPFPLCTRHDARSSPARPSSQVADSMSLTCGMESARLWRHEGRRSKRICGAPATCGLPRPGG